jgi:hypothetical protein
MYFLGFTLPYLFAAPSLPVDAISIEGLGHALKRCDRVNLHRAWMCFGLDGVTLWRQFCAVPADDKALPRGARLFANAFSQPKRRWQWRLNLIIV